MPQPRPSRATPDALAAIRARLQATQEAAQRLASDAASEARDAADGRVPPSGWDVPRQAERAGDELDALVHLIASVRDLLPPELRAQLAELVRQALVFVRAVLDWWIERIEAEAAAGGQRRGGPDDAEDIPIA
jgi:hypothetical protein